MKSRAVWTNLPGTSSVSRFVRRCWILAPLFVVGCYKEPPDAWEMRRRAHRTPPGSREYNPRSSTVDLQAWLERKERWPVKVGADERAKTIGVDDAALAKANVKSVMELFRMERPHGLPDQASGNAARWVRFGKPETTIYRVDCILMEAKYEDDDKDYHVVIRDPYGPPLNTMIIELPRPDAVPLTSPFRERIRLVREDFDRRFRVPKKFVPLNVRARVWGVGFFDFVHGQRGVAPNGIELHPVLKIEYK
jgi:hypothetical protein